MPGTGPGKHAKITAETKTGFWRQKGANDMKELMTKAVIVGLAVTWLAAGHTLAMPGTDQAEKDAKYAEKQWDKGVQAVEKGYEQLDAFDENLFESKPDSARKHLKKAAKQFGKALTCFEKAAVGRENQSAIDDINHRYDALDKALSDLEKGDVDSARRQLDKANEHFDRAAETLL